MKTATFPSDAAYPLTSRLSIGLEIVKFVEEEEDVFSVRLCVSKWKASDDRDDSNYHGRRR